MFKKKSKINYKNIIKRYLYLFLGCFLISISYNIFLLDNKLVAGGVGGVALIINHITHIHPAYIILIINLFILLISFIVLDKEKTMDSIPVSLLLPIFIYFTTHINMYFNIDITDKLLSTIFGGVIFGFGIGLVLKEGFVVGTSNILTQMLSKFIKIPINKTKLFTDTIILLISIPIFGLNSLLYSIVVIYIINFISDKVVLGISDSKAFYIITEEDDKIKDYVLKYLNHGVTVFNAKGGFKKEKETVLMCVLPTREYHKLKEGINKIDPNAFFVATDAYEVYGGE